MKIQNKIKTYEDACAIKGITPLKLEDFNALPADQREAAFAFHKITTIAEVLNEGIVWDWNNASQYKYYPWFDMETYGDAAAGSGFSYLGYVLGRTDSLVGGRLCYVSSELAKYAGTQFLDIYKSFMK